MHYNDIICNCFEVTVQDIKDAIDNGATLFKEVQEVTKAGTGCGMCVDNVKELIDDLLK